MKQANLLELAHRALAETMREITRRSHGVILEEKGLLLYASGASDAALWNGVFRTEPGLTAANLVEKAAEFFGQRQRGFTLHALEHLDADVEAELHSAGRTPDSDSPEMVLEAPVTLPTPPSGVQLHQVETDAQRADFLMAVASAFQTLGVAEETWHAAYPDVHSLAAPHIVAVVAYVEGVPAAAAMMYLSYWVAEVIHVGVHPAYRRRGLGELVTRAVTHEGFQRGARLVSLQSSPMGEGVYRRIGYREIARYRWYLFPPPASVRNRYGH